MKNFVACLAIYLMLCCQASTSQTVQLYPNESGVYFITAILNEQYRVAFVMDTGAAESSISQSLLTALEAKGCVITKLEARDFILADGRIVTKERVLIEEFQIGDVAIENVPVTVTDTDDAPMLLGQNVLRALGRIEIDYKNHVLTIYE